LKLLNSQVQQHGGMNHEAALADIIVDDREGLFRQPTAGEVSRLSQGKFRDLSARPEELAQNLFAHLLNQGSSLE